MRILLRYAAPYASQIALQLVFATVWVASQLVIPWLMADIIDNGIMRNDMEYIVRRGLLMIAASVTPQYCHTAPIAGMLGIGTALAPTSPKPAVIGSDFAASNAAVRAGARPPTS